MGLSPFIEDAPLDFTERKKFFANWFEDLVDKGIGTGGPAATSGSAAPYEGEPIGRAHG